MNPKKMSGIHILGRPSFFWSQKINGNGASLISQVMHDAVKTRKEWEATQRIVEPPKAAVQEERPTAVHSDGTEA